MEIRLWNTVTPKLVSDVIAAKILGCGVQSMRTGDSKIVDPPTQKKTRMVRYKCKTSRFMDSGRITPGSQETMGKSPRWPVGAATSSKTNEDPLS